MSGFNKTSVGRNKTTNLNGHAAYRLYDKTKLVTMALTTMLGEPKYYGDNTSDLIRLAEDLCKAGDGEFVAKLAVWARTKGNMRSVSHALMAVVGHCCSGERFVRPATRIIAGMRGDDGIEILAAHMSMYDVKWPHAIQRGVRDALEGMSPYSIAKYQARSKELKMRDVLRITHPNPDDPALSEAMGKCVDGTLPVPKGWETELSERGNTKGVWDELIAENRLGIFAQLRNLGNMIQAGADIRPVLGNLRNPEVIRKSRLLPFRFYSAYMELLRRGIISSEVSKALDMAMSLSCVNADRLSGNTAILVDTSGSMRQRVSQKSVVTCRDIAAVMAAMVCRISDNAWVCGFDGRAELIPMTGLSVLADTNMVGDSGGWTDMGCGFDALIKSGFDADRVIVLSDNEVNYSARGLRGWGSGVTIQSALEAYRRKVGHDVWCHAIDLQGYGTSQFIGHKVNIMAGWSDQVPRFISIVENGVSNIVDDIEGISLA